MRARRPRYDRGHARRDPNSVARARIIWSVVALTDTILQGGTDMASKDEKDALYDEVMAIVDDRIALERLARAESGSYAAIEAIRSDAYGVIVNLLCGHFALPDLPIAKSCAPPSASESKAISGTARPSVIVACTKAEFDLRHEQEVNMMTGLIAAYFEGTGETGNDLDEKRDSLRVTLDTWWIKRHACLEDIDPSHELLKVVV